MGQASKLSPAEERVLLEKYTPLVRRVAQSLKAMRPAVLAPEDVLQDGMIGLLRAIRSNREGNSGAQFNAYAGMSIRGAIIDSYRHAGDIPRSAYDEAKKTRQAMADGLPVSPEARAQAELVFTAAWQVEGGGATDGDAASRTPDPAPTPEQRAIANQLLRRAVDSLQSLPVRDRSIFIACELQGESQTRIAQSFGLSHGRISQIIKAVRRSILLALA